MYSVYFFHYEINQLCDAIYLYCFSGQASCGISKNDCKKEMNARTAVLYMEC